MGGKEGFAELYVVRERMYILCYTPADPTSPPRGTGYQTLKPLIAQNLSFAKLYTALSGPA